MFSLKDLKLNDLIKIALTATAIIALTFNLSILSHNTTIINNYIQETNKKLENQQSNITQVKSTVNETLLLSREILEEVD